MKTLTEQVMMNIRFPMMSPRELAELLLSPLINKYKEFFVERMAIGMIFHSGQEDRIQNLYHNENGRLLFTPRLYTAEPFSSLLHIDNFLSTPNYGTHTFMFSSHMNLAEYEGKISHFKLSVKISPVLFHLLCVYNFILRYVFLCR